VLWPSDQQVTLFPDEIGFFLLGGLQLPPLALLSLVRSAASTFAASDASVFPTVTSHGVQDVLVDVLDDVKNAQLMLGVGPDLCQNFGVKIGAIGHHHKRQETMLLEVTQKALHVILIIVANQCEGYGEITERVGGQEQRAMTEVNFIDTERSRELFQGPLAILGHVHLLNFPVEAIVEKALGQFEMEVPSQGFVKAVHAHLVVEQSVEDCFADSIGVFGPRLDSLNLSSEGLATGTTSAVFSDCQFDNEDLSVGDIADLAAMCLLEPPTFAALRTGESRRSTISFDDASARPNSIHACVLSGLS
jgi:hypothetical protein